jgi:hypothetical protein
MRQFACKFGCGTILTFDYGLVGKEGQKVPTHLDGSVHECPRANYKLSGIPNYEETLVRFALQIVDNYNAKLRRRRLVVHVEEKREGSS